jgi:zinc transport system substrate-binding protein
MKSKFLIIIMIILILTGCKKENKNSAENKNYKATTIVTSFYPIYIFALNLTKDIPDINLINMTKPQTGCLHDYQLVPEDLKTLEKSQIFIINGAGMEIFMEKVIEQMPDLKIIEASKGLELIKGEGEKLDNPHLWVSISNAILQVKNITLQLSVLDNKNSKKYKENAEIYIKKLEAQREKMHSILDNIKNKNIVTFHEAFPYFAKEFNLNIADIVEREPGSEPSAKELSDIVEKIKSMKVKALFAEPQYPAKAAETIAAETGLKVYSLDPAVTGEMKADAYIKIMENNLITLYEALK